MYGLISSISNKLMLCGSYSVMIASLLWKASNDSPPPWSCWVCRGSDHDVCSHVLIVQVVMISTIYPTRKERFFHQEIATVLKSWSSWSCNKIILKLLWHRWGGGNSNTTRGQQNLVLKSKLVDFYMVNVSAKALLDVVLKELVCRFLFESTSKCPFFEFFSSTNFEQE